jgi:hypothetical protein
LPHFGQCRSTSQRSLAVILSPQLADRQPARHGRIDDHGTDLLRHKCSPPSSVAQLADVAGPLVQSRQDVVAGFRPQADIDPFGAEVAEPPQTELFYAIKDSRRLGLRRSQRRKLDVSRAISARNVCFGLSLILALTLFQALQSQALLPSDGHNASPSGGSRGPDPAKSYLLRSGSRQSPPGESLPVTKENRDGVVEFAHAAKVCCHIERVFSRQPSAPSWRLSKPRPSCRGCWTLNDGRAARGLPPLDVQLTPLGSPQTKPPRVFYSVK